MLRVSIIPWCNKMSKQSPEHTITPPRRALILNTNTSSELFTQFHFIFSIHLISEDVMASWATPMVPTCTGDIVCPFKLTIQTYEARLALVHIYSCTTWPSKVFVPHFQPETQQFAQSSPKQPHGILTCTNLGWGCSCHMKVQSTPIFDKKYFKRNHVLFF